MKFAIAEITDAALTATARATEIGIESVVDCTTAPFEELGVVEQSAEDAGTWTAQAGAYALPSGGSDLHLRCDTPILSADPITVTFNVIDEDDASTTAVAYFAPPSWANNQSNDFQLGLATDLNVTGGASKKIKSIVGLASISGGKTGNRFSVIVLPEASQWVRIGCCEQKNAVLPIPESVAIACRFNGAEEVKRGQSPPGMLTVSAKHKSDATGLTRFSGHRCTAMVTTLKDDRIVTGRLIVGGWRPTVQTPRENDDSNPILAQAEGMLTSFAVFTELGEP